MIKPKSKYFPLYEFLRLSDQVPLVLTFDQIEGILENRLPKSARRSGSFWSNRTRGALQAQAWLDAGYQVIEVDIENERVIFDQPSIHYEVRKEGNTIFWTGSMVLALRTHLNLSQAELAEMLGVRQQTVSEWENQIYQPTRSRSKHLDMVAEKTGFEYRRNDPGE